jgi:hypothetical protein
MAAVIILLILLGLIIIALPFVINIGYNALRVRVTYVPTPDWAIAWLQDNLNLPIGSVFYEIGCGDARVITVLAKKFPDSTFVGIEIQWWPYILARWRSRGTPNLNIKHGDFWKINISDATHVFGYYFTPILPRLAEKLHAELKPGTTIISFGFALPGLQTTQEIPDPAGQTKSRLLFYRR